MIRVRPIREDEREWVRVRIAERWSSPTVVAHGVVYEPASLPGLVAEDAGGPVGLLTYNVEGDECEIVTIDAFDDGRGVGTALIDAAKALGHSRLWLITTNDNTRAQHFYEHVGFSLVRLHEGAVEHSRRLKPEIPLVCGRRNADPRRTRIRVSAEIAAPGETLALRGARASRGELVAGVRTADHAADEATPAVRERGPHELAVAAPSAGPLRRTVVRLRLRQSPNLGHVASWPSR